MARDIRCEASSEVVVAPVPDRRSESEALRAAAFLLTIWLGGGISSALAADLPRYAPLPPVVVLPPQVLLAPPAAVNPDPPSSDHGYYGYYGFDIAGTPYSGLYSATTVCLRSIRTPYGYRTVDVCRAPEESSPSR